ncbi:MAG: DNA mismatch repair protein MutS [Ignavibacteria bacterium]|nr:DNA mismatch repair protein MutS [Ignavibacteria bacterium]
MIFYELRKKHFQKLIVRLQDRLKYLSEKSNKYSLLRLVVFLTGSSLTAFAFYLNNLSGWILLAMSVTGFAITVHFHNVLINGMKKLSKYLDIKKNHMARMLIDWENIPFHDNLIMPEENSLAKDLDITGVKSLHHLMDVAVSNEGSFMLSEYLLNTNPEKEKIIFNQKIVKELSSHQRFIDKFLLKAHLTSAKKLDCRKIENYFLKLDTIPLPAWLFPVNFILIFIFLLTFILSQFELIATIWIPVFILYFFCYSLFQKRISGMFEETYETERQLRKFSSLILLIKETSSLKSVNSTEFENFLRPLKEEAPELILKLQRQIKLAVMRESPFLRLILNLIFPFDIYIYNKISIIRNDIDDKISDWLNVLNRLECFISISNFALLNPDYIYPKIESTDKRMFSAKRLGHPLLNRQQKICNDFEFKKDKKVILITGSNMSGKSTFLKTIGVNLCLAYSGAPVNAEELELSPFELFTCIKISDSVSDGISYFYAEVKKLKVLLDELTSESELSTFYLVDEIFKGTNNRERLLGGKAFIKELSRSNGFGIVTTHDLELVSLSDEIKNLSNFHFREEISGLKMVFDYKIHEGPCPTTNALKIMELSGLPVK